MGEKSADEATERANQFFAMAATSKTSTSTSTTTTTAAAAAAAAAAHLLSRFLLQSNALATSHTDRQVIFLKMKTMSVLLLLVALFVSSPLFCSAAASSSSSSSPFPPSWALSKNKTELRARFYDSLRLAPWEVQLIDGALDARDAAKAPLVAAKDAATLAVANATFAFKRANANSTFTQQVVEPIRKSTEETAKEIERARVSALNKTQNALRAGAASISSAYVSAADANNSTFFNPFRIHPLSATAVAQLLAEKLNVSANVVARRIATLTTIQEYREAAAQAKAAAAGVAPAPVPTLKFMAAPLSSTTKSSSSPVASSSSPPSSASPSASAPDVAPAPLPPRLASHPSWLVHDSDDHDIAEWVAAKPARDAAASSKAPFAAWLERVPLTLFDDAVFSSSSSSENIKEEEEGFTTITRADIRRPPEPRSQLLLKMMALLPHEAAEEAKISAVAAPAAAVPAADAAPAPPPPLDEGEEEDQDAAASEAPAVIPTIPSSSSSALELSAMPSVQTYYTYLTLRAIGVAKPLAAASAVVNTGLGFDAAV